jgi:hypothetical protein
MTASVDIVSRSRAGISSGGVIGEFAILARHTPTKLSKDIGITATLSALLAGALNMVGVGGLLGLRPEANSRMAATAKDVCRKGSRDLLNLTQVIIATTPLYRTWIGS